MQGIGNFQHFATQLARTDTSVAAAGRTTVSAEPGATSPAVARVLASLDTVDPAFFTRAARFADQQPAVFREAVEHLAANPNSLDGWGSIGVEHPKLTGFAAKAASRLGPISALGNKALDAANSVGLLQKLPGKLTEKFDPVALSALWQFTRTHPDDASAAVKLLQQEPEFIRDNLQLMRDEPALLGELVNGLRRAEINDFLTSSIRAFHPGAG